MTNINQPINLHEPLQYSIEIQGRLDPKWSASFSGMTIMTITSPGGFTVTTLQGLVADQSELHGILNHIHDLGLPLLKVERTFVDETKS